MTANIDSVSRYPRVSQVIAQALVERQSPRQIADRASNLGLNRSLTQVIVAACARTAVNPLPQDRVSTAR